MAHECRCHKRPPRDAPTWNERVAYQTVHAAGLRRDIVVLSTVLDEKWSRLHRTWFFKIRVRRELRASIAEVQGLIVGIHDHALAIGLDAGWDDPDFRPAAL